MASQRILLVEDEALVATDLSRCLTDLGYHVVAVVDTGEEAIRQAEALQPDLVLMDIHLKGELDGIAAAGQIRTNLQPPPPIVYFTSHADEATLARAGDTSPFGYVVKPYEVRALRATLEMAFYRHQSETRLRQMERWLATTLRSIGDAVLATDTHGRISYLNPTAEALTGWTLFEALGQPSAQIFRALRLRDRRPIPDPMQQVLQQGVTVSLDSDTILLCRDGRETAIDHSAAPIRDDAGGITGMVVNFRDAHRRRCQEAELHQWNLQLEARVMGHAVALRSANDQLTEANRELETFTHTFAHDLRSPLRAISGFTTLLAERSGDTLDPEARNLLEIVRANTIRMGEMVDGFVSHAKLGQVKPAFAPTEMEPLVRAVLAELLAKTGPATPELELHPLPVAWGDETLLRQVWANLLGNALKFSRQRATPRLEIGARAEAGRTIYFVRDNGTGFDMNDAGRLFSPFQRLHHADDFPGHGLGLATVERILRAHGGRIWAEARPDQGATFFFTLPLRPPVELRSRTPVAAFAEQQA